MIKVGDKLPSFNLSDQTGQEVSSDDYVGKRLLLSWHPLAFTSVCTDQMRNLAKNYETLKEKNTVPLGLSVDAQPAKAVWGQAIGIDPEEVKLLSDFGPFAGYTKELGLFLEELGASKRAHVLTDEDHIVTWVKVYETSSLPDMDEVLAQL